MSRKTEIQENNEKEIYKNGFNHGYTVAMNLLCEWARSEQRKINSKEGYLE